MTSKTGGSGVRAIGAATLACFIVAIACPNFSWAEDVPTSPNPKLYLDRSGLNEMIVQNIFYGYQIGLMTGAVIGGEGWNADDNAARVFGGALFGAFVGLVVGGKLLALSVKRRRTDYEADRASCLACGRCYSYCPKEHERLKLEREAVVARG